MLYYASDALSSGGRRVRKYTNETSEVSTPRNTNSQPVLGKSIRNYKGPCIEHEIRRQFCSESNDSNASHISNVASLGRVWLTEDWKDSGGFGEAYSTCMSTESILYLLRHAV